MKLELEDKGAFEKGDQAKHHPIITNALHCNVEMNKEKTMNVRDDDIVRRQRIGRRGTKQERVCRLSATISLSTTTKRTSLRFQVLFSDP